MLLDLSMMRHTAMSLVCSCHSTTMVWVMNFLANLWFSGNCHLHFGSMWGCSPFLVGLWGVLCGDSDVAWMSADNHPHLEKTVILVWFGVLACCLCLGSYLDLVSSLWLRKRLWKKVTDSCFIAHFVLLKTRPSFWATLNKFTKFASWSLSPLP